MKDNDGYAPIPNRLIKKLMGLRIAGEESQVLWVIIHKTFGWNKDEDGISLSQFVDATGIDRSKICRLQAKLRKKKHYIDLKTLFRRKPQPF